MSPGGGIPVSGWARRPVPPPTLQETVTLNLTLFGATGAVGSEILEQALEAGHAVRVLARSPGKLPADLPEAQRARCEVIQGDALDPQAVARTIQPGCDAVLFAIGVDSRSPEDLCTDCTRAILAAMRAADVRRFVWCGGGSTLHPRDTIGFAERFVAGFAKVFLGLRHRDKAHQLALLEEVRDIDWIGVRPLQIREGERRGAYRLGYDRFSGLSKIHFADVAHAMLRMIDDDTWIHEAPILQY